MIVLHKINGDEFVLNVDHIEIIEEKPDTTITLTNQRKYLVKESMDHVVQQVIKYRKMIYSRESY